MKEYSSGMSKKEVIFTERLQLRIISDSDQDSLVDMFLDDKIIKTYMIPEFSSKEEALTLFDHFKNLSASSAHFVYGIYFQNQIIGFINDVEMHGPEIEIGYVIHPKEQNKGFATEVLNTVIKELFGMGYIVVKAGAFEENLASMRVMEKCGMKRILQEDLIEYRGKVHRCINFEIRRT